MRRIERKEGEEEGRGLVRRGKQGGREVEKRKKEGEVVRRGMGRKEGER